MKPIILSGEEREDFIAVLKSATAEIGRLTAELKASVVREMRLMGERDRLKKENEHLMSLLKAL